MHRIRINPASLAAIVLVWLLVSASAVTGETLWRLDSDATGETVAILDRSTLHRVETSLTASFSIQAGGQIYELIVDQTRTSGLGIRSIRGRVEHTDDSYILLTSSPDGGIAALFSPNPDERWHLRYHDGHHRLMPVDATDFQPCAGALEKPESFGEEYGGIRGATSAASGDKAFGDAADDGSRHDVMVAWSPKAETFAGGAAQMEAEIQLAVDAANFVYANSGIASRLRLVITTPADYDEDSAWDYEDHLYAFADPGDGSMDELVTLRNIVGADFMVLIVESIDLLGNPTGSCGVGFVMGPDDINPEFEYLAASVVTRSCASAIWTLAHEIGHNRGCAHNREDATVDGATSYAYGHRFTGTDAQAYRTVMSYDTNPASITRVPHFANPSITYAGTATGVPIGSAGESHTAQVHGLTNSVCAGFRPERTFVDFDWMGSSTGFADAPFKTLEAGLLEARDGGQIVLEGNAPGYTAILSDPSVLVHLPGSTSVLGAP